MPNLTLVVDDAVLKRARIRALEQGTSVNALVRDYLQSYAWGSKQQEARGRLLELSDALDTGSGPGGRAWKREELYEDRVRGRR